MILYSIQYPVSLSSFNTLVWIDASNKVTALGDWHFGWNIHTLQPISQDYWPSFSHHLWRKIIRSIFWINGCYFLIVLVLTRLNLTDFDSNGSVIMTSPHTNFPWNLQLFTHNYGNYATIMMKLKMEQFCLLRNFGVKFPLEIHVYVYKSVS